MKYRFNGTSLQNKRQSNMDSLLLKKKRIGKENAMLAVVCDGVGSLIDGSFASGTAATMLGDWFDSLTATHQIGLAMRGAISSINSHIVAEASKLNLDTATTVSALLLVQNEYFIAHIGDSRIYSYSDEVLTLLTSDDISESGKLSGYVGKTAEVFLQYYEGSAADKTFLICSDGLYNLVSSDIIIEKIKLWNKRPSNAHIESLSQYVIERGEKDNISLALVAG